MVAHALARIHVQTDTTARVRKSKRRIYISLSHQDENTFNHRGIRSRILADFLPIFMPIYYRYFQKFLFIRASLEFEVWTCAFQVCDISLD